MQGIYYQPSRLSGSAKQNRASRRNKIYEFHLQDGIETSERSSPAKEFPEHVNSQECLNMYTPHEYAFNQCNEKVAKKIVSSLTGCLCQFAKYPTAVYSPFYPY